MNYKLRVMVYIAGAILSTSSFCPAQEWSFEVVKSNLTNFAVAVGDFDNDNAPDLLLHDTPNLLVWYENLQPGWTAHTIDPNTILNVQFGGVDLFDLNRDGGLDVFAYATTNPGEIVWYKNMMGGMQWEKLSINSTINQPGNMLSPYGDFDGDDDIDIAVPGVGDGKVLWFENIIGDTTWVQHEIDTLSGVLWSTVANMDEDNDPDIVVSSFNSGDIFWYENQLPDTTWPAHRIATLSGAVLGRSADMDGDGDQDVITHSLQSGVLVWYENPSWDADTLTSGIPGIVLGNIGDMDGDLDLDVTFGGDNDLGWCENLGKGSGWQRHIIHHVVNGFLLAKGLADIDSDGDPDVVATLGNGELRWYANPLITAIGEERENNLPTEFTLLQNYPNPFNPETNISYQVISPQQVVLKIFNTLGQEVITLADERKPAGRFSAHWDGKDMNGNQVPSGLYFYRIQAGSFVNTKKMLLIR